PEVALTFSDEEYVRRLVEVEVALARAQGRLGVIPQAAAGEISSAAATFEVDMDRLTSGIETAGIPTIDLIRQFQEHVGVSSAGYLHWGATTQDVIDTALVLQIRSALGVIEPAIDELIEGLASLADRHRATLMAGRTHSQQAVPIPFGLKAAGWLAPLFQHRQRLQELKPRLLVVQLGGAAGTLASYGDRGLALQRELAAELGLRAPLMPWHTQRDRLVELANWLTLVTDGLAKMSQDIILMGQSEIGEVWESRDRSRGGSSTMPQKSNPILSELILSAARTNISLLSSMHHASIQENERGTHGWQVEWINFPPMFSLTAASLKKAVYLSHNLYIDEGRMRRNVEASNGLMLAEAITFALSETMDRTEAQALVKEACRTAIADNRHLVDVVREKTPAALDWDRLRDESAYFGSADALIDRVLEQAERVLLERKQKAEDGGD
ncbi:MAG TPA: 3-carboxy-cis,cis-muconate cycloisomerase, partial [Anaerolineales bacterium]|nr:3-carboxy-cis,cis-muconate cycloisomerase [Anaerolineales bacterium]